MKTQYNGEHWLGSLFRRISIKLTNVFDHKLSEYGVSSSNYWILKPLWETDGLTQKQLVEKLGVKPASVTKMIDTMIEKQLVKRKCDDYDARIKRVYLTKKGKELEHTLTEIISECESLMVEGFASEEILVLKKELYKVIHNLEKR